MPSDHTWRGKPEDRDSWREWIRRNVESAREGYIFEDIDLVPWLVARRYFGILDPVGRFMIIERKLGNADMGKAQIRTFGLIDHILRKGDPQGQRYGGLYLLNHPHEDHQKCTHVIINREKLTMDQFKQFLKFEHEIPPYEFPDYVWKGDSRTRREA
ncbi:hypothetical protein ES703_20556 [subsurface metagenome]